MEGYHCQQGSQHLAPYLQPNCCCGPCESYKRKAACKQAAFPTSDFPSEPEMGPEGDAQIVLGTIIEVNLVAYVQSQSDRAQEAFDTSAWIECKLGVAAGHP